MKHISLKDFLRDPSLKDKLTTPQLNDLLSQITAITSGLLISQSVPKDVLSLAEKFSGGKWKKAKHLEILSRSLGELELGLKKRLLVSMPPRHGKSEMISFWFPIWFLARHPDKKIILCSYEAEFAASWGMRVRNAIVDFGSELGLEIDETAGAAKHNWILKTGGGMITAGAGGPITGKGAHCLIVDDPIKNSEEAQSETLRESLWNWWQTTAFTRLEPGGFTVMVATRWHQDDLLGRLEQAQLEGGPKWDSIKLPALAESNDPLGREPEAPLWPERIDMEMLNDIRSGMSPYNWSALYQQRPSPEEGGGVKRKWWGYYHAGHPPVDMETQIQSWDLSFKDAKTSDFCVGQVWGRKGGRFYLLDQVRERMNSVDVIKAVRNLRLRHPKATAILIEDKANGPAVIATLQDELSGIIPVKVKASKDARLQGILPIIESGAVHLPGKKNGQDEWIPAHQWVADFIEEHAAFPNGTNDDQLDACVHALTYMQPQAWREIGHAWKEAKKAPPAKTTAEIQQKQFWDWTKKSIKKTEKRLAERQTGTAFQIKRRKMW